MASSDYSEQGVPSGDMRLTVEQQDRLLSAILDHNTIEDLDECTIIDAFGDESGPLESFRALKAVRSCIAGFYEEARNSIPDSLHKSLTELSSKHKKTVGWILLKRRDGVQVVSSYGDDSICGLLSKEQLSVIKKAESSSAPVPVPDVRADSSIKSLLPDTWSSLAVPLFASAGEVSGFIYLESTSPHEFTDIHLSDYSEIIREIIPPLMTLRSLERIGTEAYPFPWKSFNITPQMELLANTIRRALDPVNIQCAFWSVHHENGQLFVHCTTGIFSEYLVESYLPSASFNGKLMGASPIAVGSVLPDQPCQIHQITPHGMKTSEGPYASLAYDNEIQVRYYDWKESVGTPIYALIPGQTDARVTATLCLSHVSRNNRSRLPSRQELHLLAHELGIFITGYYLLREQIAFALIEQATRRSPRPLKLEDGLIPILHEVFDLHQASINDDLPIRTRDEIRIGQRMVKIFQLDIPISRFPMALSTHVRLTSYRPFSLSLRELAQRIVDRCVECLDQTSDESHEAQQVIEN